jgi:bifunctional DNase/RNase
MEKIGLDIVGLTYSQTQTGAYALVLGEKNGKRRLPVIIGGFEAQAIAIEIEKMTPSRPLTHDLFKTFADTFQLLVDEVIIYNLVEGIFFAKIICKRAGESETFEIDARTSDAVALAVRFKAPISTYEFILSSAGIIMDEDEEGGASPGEEQMEEVERQLELSHEELSVEELEEQLMSAIDREDYEAASRIRDEISRRKKD